MCSRLIAVVFAFCMVTSSYAQTFNDVPKDNWAYRHVEVVAANGITAGCGGGNYCPLSQVTRAQMAVFLERGMRGSDFRPPAAKGNVFLDVGATDFAASYIEQLYLDGVTGGCGGGKYCPTATVTRAQMAVFLLRAKHGPGYSPPPATGMFLDVPLSHWAVHWIEQLAREGITGGCGNDNYCPEAAVTRDQMAVFLGRTFGLVHPGVLTLFLKNSGSLDPVFNEVPLPYSSSATIVVNVSGVPAPTTYTLDRFKLSAQWRDFTISDLMATDSTGTVMPYFSGLSNGQVVAAGEEVLFDVVSPLTRGVPVQLTFSFEMAETQQIFTAQYSFTSN